MNDLIPTAQRHQLPMQPSILGGLLDRDGLCEELSCSPRTVLRLEHQGMPVIIVRGMRFYSPDSVRAWMISLDRKRNEVRRGRPGKNSKAAA